NLQHVAAVFAGLDRRRVALDAADEMRHLLGEAVVPDLLEHGKRVALGRAGLFDGVAVALLAVGQERAAAEEIGAGEAGGAVNLAAVVDAARLGPAILRNADLPAFVLDDADAVIFALRLGGVNVGAEVGRHALDARLAEDPAGVFDG